MTPALRKFAAAVEAAEHALAALDAEQRQHRQAWLAAWAPDIADARYTRELRRRFARLQRPAARGWTNRERWEREFRALGIDVTIGPPSRIGAAVKRVCGR